MQTSGFKVPDDPSQLRDLVGVLMSELKNRDIRITDLEQRLALLAHASMRCQATGPEPTQV